MLQRLDQLRKDDRVVDFLPQVILFALQKTRLIIDTSFSALIFLLQKRTLGLLIGNVPALSINHDVSVPRPNWVSLAVNLKWFLFYSPRKNENNQRGTQGKRKRESATLPR